MNRFIIIRQHKQARLGRLKTRWGEIDTPNFIPVGTQATVKAQSPCDLKKIGVQAVLCNTYHLMLRPGWKTIKKMDGLHNFMGWDLPVMTDSGGFQVFSLGVALEHGVGKLLRSEPTQPRARLNKVTESGVLFQSHIDGSMHKLTPELSITIQHYLGSDLMVVFDDLESPKYDFKQTRASLERSNRWQMRSLYQFKKLYPNSLSAPLLYGVTHGGVFKKLREESARFVDENFEGVALGGAHTDRKSLCMVIEWTAKIISSQKPRHLLGIGEVEDIIQAVERGVDLFDCAAPTRRARNGSLYISPGAKYYPSLRQYRLRNFTLNIKSSRFATDKKPVDPSCLCLTCQNFSRAYLHHLFKSGELLYFQLATHHNLFFINNLMDNIRQAIKKGEWRKLKHYWLGQIG